MSHPTPPSPTPMPLARRITLAFGAFFGLLGDADLAARLIDFANEDLAGCTDAQIGTAARVVHEGCAKVLREHFRIVAVRDEAEGSAVTLPAGFDAQAVRLTGKVVGTPPFRGRVGHRGWRAAEVRLPRLAEGHDGTVLAPAEVEL